MQLFPTAVQMALQLWPALQLTISNDSDPPTKHPESGIHIKIHHLSEETYGDRIEVDDMIEFFGAFFQDVFSLEIDDGSLGQTAKLICDLWRELGNADLQQSSDSSSTATIQHSSPTLNELYKRWSERAVAVPAAQILDQRRYIDDEDAVVDDDEMEVDKSQQQTECKSSTDQTASSFSNKKQENVVEVDEDGVEWTVVRKGRR